MSATTRVRTWARRGGRRGRRRARRRREVAAAAIDPSALERRGPADLRPAEPRSCAQGRARLASRIDRFEVANHLDGPVSILGSIASIAADRHARARRPATRPGLRAFPRYLEEAIAVVARGGRRPASSHRWSSPSARSVARPAARSSHREQSPALAPAAERRGARAPARGRHAAGAPGARRVPDVLRRRLPPGVHRDDRALGAPRRRRDVRGARSHGWTSLPLDPARSTELGANASRRSSEERFGSRRSSATRAAAEADRRPQGQRAGHSVEPRGARWRSPRTRSSAAGRRPPRSSAACRAPTAPCGWSRSSARPINLRPSTTRRPRTASRRGDVLREPLRAGRTGALHQLAGVTFHEANPGHHFQVALEQEIARPAGAAPVRRAGSWARRSRRVGGCTPSAWPTRWSCTWTTGSAWACSRTRGCARPGWSPTRASMRSAGRAKRAIDAAGVECGQTPADAGDRDRPLHRHAGAGALLHDRHDRDRARPREGHRGRP